MAEIPYFSHFFWQAPAGLVEITTGGFGHTSVSNLSSRYASKGQNARYAPSETVDLGPVAPNNGLQSSTSAIPCK